MKTVRRTCIMCHYTRTSIQKKRLVHFFLCMWRYAAVTKEVTKSDNTRKSMDLPQPMHVIPHSYPGTTAKDRLKKGKKQLSRKLQYRTTDGVCNL